MNLGQQDDVSRVDCLTCTDSNSLKSCSTLSMEDEATAKIINYPSPVFASSQFYFN